MGVANRVRNRGARPRNAETAAAKLESIFSPRNNLPIICQVCLLVDSQTSI